MKRGIPILLMVTLIGGFGLAGSRGEPQGKGKDKAGRSAEMAKDQEVFHFLLDHHKEIQRTVKETANGVETLTESDNPQVAGKIKEHVQAMKKRMDTGNGIRLRDPLFAALFSRYKAVEMSYQPTEKGVKVIESSKDPLVALWIKAHAKVVSGFVDKGHAEASKNHELPKP